MDNPFFSARAGGAVLLFDEVQAGTVIRLSSRCPGV